MNEITSEYDGEIVNAYVDNGKPVQYGERLFAIRTSRPSSSGSERRHGNAGGERM